MKTERRSRRSDHEVVIKDTAPAEGRVIQRTEVRVVFARDFTTAAELLMGEIGNEVSV